MFRLRLMTLAATTTLTLVATPGIAAENAAEEAQEKPIQLSQVPQAAVDAAQKALGAKPTGAKVMQENGQQVYELETTETSGKVRGVHVTADGKVLKREAEEEKEGEGR